MIRQRYKCTLLSDIVITKTAATEGFNPTLDYIPGAKFLGIIASQLYKKNTNSTNLEMFHNGTIHYGDAHPIINNEKSYKVPFSWFFAKGDRLDNGIWLNHYLTTDIYKDLIEKSIQPKQARSGYFVENLGLHGNYINVDKHFSIKSSFDKFKRRAKDEQMYGYNALGKGTDWEFHIEMENDTFSNLIKTSLEGKKRIGKSRSAEYGLVEINFIHESEINNVSITDKQISVYAESNLCFYDKFGRNTLQPNPEQLGINIKDATILWKKSQIRNRLYQTWNQHRFNRDSDRVIIEKGSVFIVNIPTDHKGDITVPHKVGAHYSEGFGKVLFNPEFLNGNKETATLTENIIIKKIDGNKLRASISESKAHYPVKEAPNDEIILRAINARKYRKNKTYSIDEQVNHFKKDYKDKFSGVTKSQWGALRSYAKGCNNWKHFDDLVFNENVGFLNSGKMKKQWEESKSILESYLKEYNNNDVLDFAQKLFSEMQKDNPATKEIEKTTV